MIQDLFIFCCYTGLAFNEMAHLEKQHIQIGFDGINWIKMTREKTRRLISIPILPKAQEIILKYSSKSNRILPSISNQKFNSYLKEIADITGIEKRLTHHIARKTFASTVLLYNDVPMEIVSELLGHSNMTITQESYGKIVQKKVSEAIKKLAEKLKYKFIILTRTIFFRWSGFFFQINHPTSPMFFWGQDIFFQKNHSFAENRKLITI